MYRSFSAGVCFRFSNIAPEIRSHLVEGVCQLLKLVTGGKGHPVLEVALTQRCGGMLERFNRPGDDPGELHGRKTTMSRIRKKRPAKISRIRSVCSKMRARLAFAAWLILLPVIFAGATISAAGIETAKLQFSDLTGAYATYISSPSNMTDSMPVFPAVMFLPTATSAGMSLEKTFSVVNGWFQRVCPADIHGLLMMFP